MFLLMGLAQPPLNVILSLPKDLSMHFSCTGKAILYACRSFDKLRMTLRGKDEPDDR